MRDDFWWLQLARVLVHVRLEAGMTQRQLAARVDLDDSVISHSESSKRTRGITLDKLMRIAEACGTTVSAILKRASLGVDHEMAAIDRRIGRIT